MSNHRRLARTPELLAAIVDMRTKGRSWVDIGTALGLASSTAAALGVEMGITKCQRRSRHNIVRHLAAPVPQAEPDPLARDPDPLPPGHPLTWGVITDIPYPHQVAA